MLSVNSRRQEIENNISHKSLHLFFREVMQMLQTINHGYINGEYIGENSWHSFAKTWVRSLLDANIIGQGVNLPTSVPLFPLCNYVSGAIPSLMMIFNIRLLRQKPTVAIWTAFYREIICTVCCLLVMSQCRGRHDWRTRCGDRGWSSPYSTTPSASSSNPSPRWLENVQVVCGDVVGVCWGVVGGGVYAVSWCVGGNAPGVESTWPCCRSRHAPVLVLGVVGRGLMGVVDTPWCSRVVGHAG